MKLIAINTINLGDGKSAAPGAEFEISNETEAKELIEAGVAEQKTRTVTDDGKDAPAKVEVKKDGPAVTKG
jgi:hypothetical protein